ncbi:MAG: cell division topological specificity factor MinE [Oligoflexia bacterium]|nr:cell division topological specificity factor MinE [Oligoflexia bacterium]
MFAALREKLFGSKNGLSENGQGRSRALARSRLQFVLVQDRTGLTPEEMTQFKKEMVSVIERYFRIDEKGFDISYKREGDTSTLLINSPVIVRRKEDKSESSHSEKGDKKESKNSAEQAA